MRNNDMPIEEQFEKAFTQASGANPVFPFLAKQEMGKMLDVISKSNHNIDKALSTSQSNAIKGGFIAEEFHAETFNLDAILKDNDARAFTDNHNEWYSSKYDGKILKKNDTLDIIITKDGEVVATAQSKYCQTAEDTTREMSQVLNDGSPKYNDIDQLIGPDDQINPQNGEVSIKEHAEASAEGYQTRGEAQGKIDARSNTAEKQSSTLNNEDVNSTPLTKQEADTLGSGDKSKLQEIENQYQTKSTIKHMRQSATNAAAMSAIISGSINSIKYIQQVREGKITAEEATFAIVKETACSAADSAIKAGANAGIQSLMVRHGAETVVINTFAKQSLKSMIKTNAVTVGVVCIIDAIKDLVYLGSGKISEQDFYERQGKNILNTSAGVVGGSLGATATAGIIASAGLTGATASTLMVVGGLSGGLIAGLAMSLAIENGIERPYKDLVKNTSQLKDASQELQQVAQNVFIGQIAFSQFLEENLNLDNTICSQQNKVNQAGQNAFNAIMKI